MKTTTCAIHDDLSKEEELFARDRLTEHGEPFAGPRNTSEINLALRDANGELRGALHGTIMWRWLHVSVLWVAGEQRGRGHGAALLASAETIARERKCKYAKLHTFSFQARPFYEAHGYRVISETSDFPEGHVQYLLVKALP